MSETGVKLSRVNEKNSGLTAEVLWAMREIKLKPLRFYGAAPSAGATLLNRARELENGQDFMLDLADILADMGDEVKGVIGGIYMGLEQVEVADMLGISEKQVGRVLRRVEARMRGMK